MMQYFCCVAMLSVQSYHLPSFVTWAVVCIISMSHTHTHTIHTQYTHTIHKYTYTHTQVVLTVSQIMWNRDLTECLVGEGTVLQRVKEAEQRCFQVRNEEALK